MVSGKVWISTNLAPEPTLNLWFTATSSLSTRPRSSCAVPRKVAAQKPPQAIAPAPHRTEFSCPRACGDLSNCEVPHVRRPRPYLDVEGPRQNHGPWHTDFWDRAPGRGRLFPAVVE